MTEDFDVFEAGNGADAMVRAKEAIYDLVRGAYAYEQLLYGKRVMVSARV